MKTYTQAEAATLLQTHDSPLYVYDAAWLKARAKQVLEAAKQTDCTVRYAMKANPHPEIIRLFDELGIQFDASSEFEVTKLIEQGIEPSKISLSSQQPPRDTRKTLESGVRFVATSLHQLKLVAESGWQGDIAVRINPGVGSGHSKRVTTGGASASFGIWHKYIPQILEWEKNSAVTISRLHVHIGAGADPAVWQGVIQTALELVDKLPSVDTLDIGGGYKVARVDGEQDTDMTQILATFAQELQTFESRTGRHLKLEIEPGTWLVANSGTLFSTITDIVDTGSEGYIFLKLDTGMNDILRPSLYGAQHPIKVLNDATEQQEYIVVGHNCESGDILTPAPGDPESLAPRMLNKAKIGDIVAIGGAGAYCASMRAIGYNSFLEAREVVV